MHAVTRGERNFNELDRFFNPFWDGILNSSDAVTDYVMNVVLANLFDSILPVKFIQMLVVNQS